MPVATALKTDLILSPETMWSLSLKRNMLIHGLFFCNSLSTLKPTRILN